MTRQKGIPTESPDTANAEKLRQSEENYRNIFNSTHNGIFLYNRDTGAIIDVNRAAIDMYGYSKEELMKMRAGTLGTGDILHSREAASDWFRKARESGYELFQWLARHKDGTEFWVEVELKTVQFNGEETIISVERNIHDRKMAEEKLKESEASYRDLFNHGIDAIYIQNRKGEFIDVNRGAEKMYGYSREEMTGKTPEFLSAEGKNNMDEVRSALRKAELGEPQQFEFWGKRKNGEVFPKIVRLNKGRFFGEEVVFAFAVDMTEQHRAEEERRKIERQFIRSRNLESLGFLAGGIAHDFNNILTGILGNTGLLRKTMEKSVMGNKYIDRIESSTARAAELCSQLLAFSGKGKFVILPVDINSIVLELTRLLETALPNHIQLKNRIRDVLPFIDVDPTQFKQIVMNLILNASDSIGDEQGTITIRTGMEHGLKRDEKAVYFLTENTNPSEFIYLEVGDSGEGIEDKMIERIFDPFFTSRSMGKGLGLSAVIGIVKSHGGYLRVKSTLGCGSSFRLYFPVSSKEAVEEKKPARRTDFYPGEGTILIADDEPTIREMAGVTLENHGFEIIVAADGREAVEIYRRKKKDIILLVLDLTMPELDGIEVIKEIHRSDPEVKAILSSGFSRHEAIEDLEQKGFSAFLPKPYKPEDLIEVVMSVLTQQENTSL